MVTKMLKNSSENKYQNGVWLRPGCGQVQSIEDFRKYKDNGATPDWLRASASGRYEGGNASWIAGKIAKGKRCDYAGDNLLLGQYFPSDRRRR